MSLRDRIIAEIDRREATARAADSPGQHLSISWPRTSGKTALLAFLNESGPDDALRRYAHYRKVLERHRPVVRHTELRHKEFLSCYACEFPWPCADLADLAEALGLSIEDES